MTTPSASHEILSSVDQVIRRDFDANRRILSYDEYLVLVAESPAHQMRGSASYMADMMDHFGRTPVSATGQKLSASASKASAAKASSRSGSTSPSDPATERFNLFDEVGYDGARRVIGQEAVQHQLYRALKTFARQGINNKLLLLHGPNGSAKTSLIHAMMAGMERYSREPEGAQYTFSWVFPVERLTKGGMGMNTYSQHRETLASFAKLPDEDVQARIPCDMKDHPLLLIPLEQRRSVLEKLLGQKRADEVLAHSPIYLTKGDLCHRCKQVFERMLAANGGDYRKVLMHIQVERFYFSRRYRNGLVTVEPQMHVDAHYQQLTMNKNITALPPSLQTLNLFTMTGDLIDGNRGVVEYSDLLKRPIDTFKYLLIACETGAVNVGASIAYLDTVMLGSSNEIQLDAFKEFPDFVSFKARIELIRVPYLMSSGQEQEIYRGDLEVIAGEKHVAPHTGWSLALWAVLTRLKKPNSINYPPNVSTIVSNLSPLEKAKLYDTGEMPVSLPPEDRKLLRATLRKIREEYTNIPYYEGRIGASAREMKSILYSAAQNTEFTCLSPLAVFREMEEFVKRVSEYDFLKQDVKDGFHDAFEFISTVRNEYLARVDHEVRSCIGLYDSAQWEDFLKKYVLHISLLIKKEKIKNPITGRLEDPDFPLINEFEKIVDAPAGTAERDSFRQNIISQVGAWSLDHRQEPVVYAKVFPEFWHKLEKHYYEGQKALLTKMHNALLVYDKEGAAYEVAESTANEEGVQLARKTVENMKAKVGYCDHCAREVITFLMRSRY